MRQIDHLTHGATAPSIRFGDVYNPNTGAVQAHVGLVDAALLDVVVQAAPLLFRNPWMSAAVMVLVSKNTASLMMLPGSKLAASAATALLPPCTPPVASPAPTRMVTARVERTLRARVMVLPSLYGLPRRPDGGANCN